MINNTKLAFIVLIVFSIPVYSYAKDTSKWKYLGDVYMMFPNMKGETTVASLPEVIVDAPASNILGHLQMGAMMYLEASDNNWAISSDLLYMKLGQDLIPGKLVVSGNATMKEFAWEVAGLKRFTPWLEGGLACRMVSLYAGLDITTINSSSANSAVKTWFDPVFVARSNYIFKDKWLAQFRADCGGFGIGSDFTWQLQIAAGYRFSKLFQTTIGYRYIGINYDKGEGKDRFMYDVDTYGWVVHFGFNF